ncbi:MAG TPA: hypothetical protein VLC53_18310 [Myxococcota bacterium]|nr:hypothetical protein [Myxococcota bacterium]
MKFGRALLAAALVASTGALTSCATIREDPVLCGVIGSVAGGLAGGFLGAAVADGNAAFPAILGTTLGATIGGFGAYQVCKNPTLGDTADARARERRLDTSPANDD